jgi:hypothetical protein
MTTIMQILLPSIKMTVKVEKDNQHEAYSTCLLSKIIPKHLVKNVVPDAQKMRYDFVNL